MNNEPRDSSSRSHGCRSAHLILGMVSLLLGGPAAPAWAADANIRLVLQITVDGLRSDLLERYRGGFGDGGFNHLLRNGTVYTNAHYQHANTETIVGHATLATGSFPSQHGMVGNV